MNGTGDGNIHAGTFSEKLAMVIIVALGITLLILAGGDLFLCYLGKVPPASTGITIGAILGIMGAALSTKPDPNKKQADQSAGPGGKIVNTPESAVLPGGSEGAARR